MAVRAGVPKRRREEETRFALCRNASFESVK